MLNIKPIKVKVKAISDNSVILQLTNGQEISIPTKYLPNAIIGEELEISFHNDESKTSAGDAQAKELLNEILNPNG